ENLGIMGNFNACIQRSRGELVHILHSDDYVEDRFYDVFHEAFASSSRCAIIFSRSLIVDEQDQLLELSEYCESLRIESNDARDFMLKNPVRAPGVVVRRDFYERHGGFDTSLVHTGDWDMWVRAIVNGGGYMLDRPWAYYRWHNSNDSNQLARTAE